MNIRHDSFVTRQFQTILIASAVLIILTTPYSADAGDFLSGGEVVAIGAGSLGTAVLGELVLNLDTARGALLGGPLPGEASLQQFLGGQCWPGKSNFLDSNLGSAYTAFGAGILLVGANFSSSASDEGQRVAQDLFLFTAGLTATKGITSLAKGIVARPRPLACLPAEPVLSEEELARPYYQRSFFSGHTSSAFFAVTFANKRIRSVMRGEMSASEYRDWRWAPPALLFGWASFVGWSRIHVWKHFLSDVHYNIP